MGLALSGVGYDDALFVDNGAYTRVRSIARAIERTQQLAGAYDRGGIHDPVIKRFVLSTAGKTLDQIRSKYSGAGLTQAERDRLSKRGGRSKTQARAPGARGKAAFWQNLSGDATEKHTTVTAEARRAIADILGVGSAYRRAEAHKRASYGAIVTQRSNKFGQKSKYLGTQAERSAARKQAWSSFGEGSSDPVFAAEARRAAARSRVGSRYATLSPEQKARVMSQYASAPKYADMSAEDLRNLRMQSIAAAYEGARHYGPRSTAGVGSAARREKKAAKGSTGLSADVVAAFLAMPGAEQLRNGRLRYKGAFIKNEKVKAMVSGAGRSRGRGRGRDAEGPAADIDFEVPFNNPFGFLGADDFGAVALSNPLIGASTESTGIKLFDDLEAKAASLPGVGPVAGSVAALAAPIAFGVGASAVHLLVVPKLLAWDKTPDVIKPYAYTLTGSLVGVVAGAASTQMKQHPQARAATQLVGGAAALVGVGIDLYRNNFFGLLGGRSSDTAGLALSGEMGDSDDDEGEFGGLALSGDFAGLALSGDFGAVALSGDLGDGGAYQIQPVGMDSALGAMHQHYADAMYGDAAVCGPDLSEAEGNAALAGVGAFFGTFGQTPHSTMRVNLGTSRHAGREGHRWGWLIKLVGFAEFQRIVALPPADRCAVIEQMRVAAIEAAKGGLAKQQARMLASQSVEAPEALGPRGIASDYANADAFGALMVAGPGGL